MARSYWFDSMQIGSPTADGIALGYTGSNATVNGGAAATGGPYNDRYYTNYSNTHNYGLSAASIADGLWRRIASHVAGNIFQGLDAGTAQFTVRRTTTGTIEVRTGGNAGTIIGTSGVVLSLSAWQFIEIEVTVHNTTGTVQIWVDGTSVLTLTGVNTRGGTANSFVTQISAGDATGDTGSRYSIGETAASTATRLGPVKPYLLVATGDGAHTAWTANTGTRWQAIDEVPVHDGETTYIFSNTPGDKNSIDITNTVAGIGTIFGLAHYFWERRDDAGPHTLRAFLRDPTGPTIQNEATETSSASYVGHGYWREFSPFTGGSTRWTASEIDTLQLGEELVT